MDTNQNSDQYLEYEKYKSEATICTEPLGVISNTEPLGVISNTEPTEISDGEEENMKAIQQISQKELNKLNTQIEKSGVCYMSRIPPFMKHTVLRQMLLKYGEVGRIYLNPEDSKIAAKRRKYKKNKRVNYIEGWIEFADKKVARKIALLLNNTNMGGKKRSYYYDDIWNIKYLPKFKWNHLTEQLAYELKVNVF